MGVVPADDGSQAQPEREYESGVGEDHHDCDNPYRYETSTAPPKTRVADLKRAVIMNIFEKTGYQNQSRQLSELENEIDNPMTMVFSCLRI